LESKDWNSRTTTADILEPTGMAPSGGLYEGWAWNILQEQTAVADWDRSSPPRRNSPTLSTPYGSAFMLVQRWLTMLAMTALSSCLFLLCSCFGSSLPSKVGTRRYVGTDTIRTPTARRRSCFRTPRHPEGEEAHTGEEAPGQEAHCCHCVLDCHGHRRVDVPCGVAWSYESCICMCVCYHHHIVLWYFMIHVCLVRKHNEDSHGAISYLWKLAYYKRMPTFTTFTNSTYDNAKRRPNAIASVS
jgi:hypothetical protein